MVRVRLTHGIVFAFVFTCFTGLAIISNSKDNLRTVDKDDLVKDPGSDASTTFKPSTRRDVAEVPVSSKIWSNFSGIYVRSAYRISDDEIRFVYLEEAQNRRGINALVNKKWSKVKSTCFNDTSCEDYLYCSIATRFGSIDISSVRHSFREISLAAEGSEEFFNVNVKDVSIGENHVYEHSVGVCVQPVFYLADWPLVIQFFESWLAQGATKFYFYAHSYTRQVKAVLEFYKRTLDKDLELILWSDLPVRERDRGDYSKDPNSRVFRHGAIAFMHDCMLRARSYVKYVANFDLDDFPVAEHLNLPEVLDSIDKENKNIAEIIVDWKLTRQKIQWEALRTPSDIRFMLSASRVIADANIRYDYRISKKMFTRPERVAVFDMHNVYRNELVPGHKEQYGYISYSSPKLFLLHMRRFQRHLISDDTRYNTTINARFLVTLNRSMMNNFKKRLQFDEFAGFQMAPWATEANEILRNLEQCRKEAFGMMLTDENRMCQQSSGGCEPMLMTRSKFIRAPISWVDLAHTARFNNYTVSQKH